MLITRKNVNNFFAVHYQIVKNICYYLFSSFPFFYVLNLFIFNILIHWVVIKQ